MGRIVVGVDGSDASTHALRWALAEAKLRSCSVLVVHAWLYPYATAAAGYSPAAFTIPMDVLQKDAERVLDTTLADVADTADGIKVERTVAEGPAASVLTEAASPDDLLVVGSRGRGGFSGLLLGSVSQQCAHHAPCPVVIVRD